MCLILVSLFNLQYERFLNVYNNAEAGACFILARPVWRQCAGVVVARFKLTVTLVTLRVPRTGRNGQIYVTFCEQQSCTVFCTSRSVNHVMNMLRGSMLDSVENQID